MKKTLRNTLITLAIFSSSAFAAGSAATGESGLLVSLFVGFFALIIVFQFVPAVLLMVGMIKGLFGSESKEITSY